MELLERDASLALLWDQLRETSQGGGHCIFITGEPGIGKTSLVREFLTQAANETIQYTGSCDLLFTPRPLAPLYDIASQIDGDLFDRISSIASRSELFLKFVHEISCKDQPVVVVFEDVHWADEATLDFIKFFARRISRIQCLFVLTWRDDDVHGQHPLRNILAHLAPGTYTRLQLSPLSVKAVEQLAQKRGYDANDVHSISGGNPFYVNEILAHYSPGVPDNIKDSVLVVYESLSDETKETWQLLSVIPEGLEIQRLKGISEHYLDSIGNCIAKKILINKNDTLSFKHELYRRTIEESLSPFKRIELNKKVIDLFLASFEAGNETERIVQYAKNANEYDLVFMYAPVAAQKATSVGAHTEAAKLYLTAIEYYHGNDTQLLAPLYEAYAYECHLTNQVKEAIIYQKKALGIRKEMEDSESLGNCMRFLSRLWWFDGNRKEAEYFAEQAVQTLEKQPPSRAGAMAYSNMAALKLQSCETDACIYWGQKALAIAEEINDAESLSHILNNIGSAAMLNHNSLQDGIHTIRRSMEIALQHSLHEYAARGYAALGSNAVMIREYEPAKQFLEEGISFCEDKDLDSIKSYILSWKARLLLETGNWKEAENIATILTNNDSSLSIIRINALVVLAAIKMRKGAPGVLSLLTEAKELALKTMELPRILPAVTIMLEFEWLTGISCIGKEDVDMVISLIKSVKKDMRTNTFSYWLSKAKPTALSQVEKKKNNPPLQPSIAAITAREWEEMGCPYEQALALFEGREEEKRNAVSLMSELAADAVTEKLKQEMRNAGIRNIPRGIRKATKDNPALLTGRELDVLALLKEGIQNKDIAARLYISPKTVDHHISSILTKLDTNSRTKAVTEAVRMGILK